MGLVVAGSSVAGKVATLILIIALEHNLILIIVLEHILTLIAILGLRAAV